MNENLSTLNLDDGSPQTDATLEADRGSNIVF